MIISGKYIRTNSEEFIVTHSDEFLVTHSEEFLVTHSKEFSGISKDYVSYSVLRKIRTVGDQVLRISQEFQENYS